MGNVPFRRFFNFFSTLLLFNFPYSEHHCVITATDWATYVCCSDKVEPKKMDGVIRGGSGFEILGTQLPVDYALLRLYSFTVYIYIMYLLLIQCQFRRSPFSWSLYDARYWFGWFNCSHWCPHFSLPPSLRPYCSLFSTTICTSSENIYNL